MAHYAAISVNWQGNRRLARSRSFVLNGRGIPTVTDTFSPRSSNAGYRICSPWCSFAAGDALRRGEIGDVYQGYRQGVRRRRDTRARDFLLEVLWVGVSRVTVPAVPQSLRSGGRGEQSMSTDSPKRLAEHQAERAKCLLRLACRTHGRRSPEHLNGVQVKNVEDCRRRRNLRRS